MKNIKAQNLRARMGRILFWICLCALAPVSALGVQISEVCASNKSAYVDESGDTPDWIELYNEADAPASLDGFFLSDDEDDLRQYSLDGLQIEPGGYLLLRADGRELPFSLSSGGETLYFTRGDETFALAVPALKQNQSFSLLSGGGYGITDATPGKENAQGEAYTPPAFVAAPRFARDAGFYNEPFSLEITAPEGCEIRYTLDGSRPGADSALYAGPIYIADGTRRMDTYCARTDISVNSVTAPKTLQVKGTVVRAVTVDAHGNLSHVRTGAYFVGLQNRSAYQGLPILSIAVEPDEMFGAENGIYMLGRRYADWLLSEAYDPLTPKNNIPSNYRVHGLEIEADVEWFEASGELTLSQTLGLRIHGNFSRHDAQKSFKLYARGQYGGGKLGVSFFEGQERASKVVVRNGGNNHVVMFLDAFAHELLSRRGLPVSDSAPCLAFVNGEFWGLYNMRQAQDEEYIASQCGVDEDQVILIKNGALSAGRAGEIRLYQDFLQEIAALNCALPADYARAQQLMDVDSYVNYLAGGIYLECVDWLNITNNFTLWRTRETANSAQADTRWRWIYQDLDYSCGYGASDPTPVQLLLSEPIFSALWTSPQFEEKFLTCVMDIANIDCAMARVNALLNETSALYRAYVPETYLRYSMNVTLKDFDAQVKQMREFFEKRPDQVAKQLTEALKISRARGTLSLSTDAKPLPDVTLNGRALAFENKAWAGQYFEGSMLTLVAGDMTGYRFLGWYENGVCVCADRVYTFAFEGGRALSPRYLAVDAAATLNRECPPMRGGDSAVALSTGAYHYDATLRADDGLALSVQADQTSVLLSPGGAWPKGLGFVLEAGTAGFDACKLDLRLCAGEGAPASLRVLYSLNGEDYTEIDTVRINAGENALSLSLPEALNDQYRAYLRVEAAKKRNQGDNALTVRALCLRGERLAVTLANLNRCADICEARMKGAFLRPDAAALGNLSQAEIAAKTAEMYAALATYMANETARPLCEEDARRVPALEGALGQAYFSIPSEACLYAQDVRVCLTLLPLTDGQSVYAYALEGAQARFLGEFAVSQGETVLPARAGEYALLCAPLETYHYRARFFAEQLDEAFQEAVFGAPLTESYLWLRVELLTAYQDCAVFTLPEDGGIPAGARLYLYAVEAGALSQRASLSADENGAYAYAAPQAGTYLVLQSTPAAYRARAREEASPPEKSADGAGIGRREIALLGCGACACALACVFLVRRARKRKRGE